MLTEDQLEVIGEALTPLFQYLEKEVIADIARRIQGTMSFSRTAELKAIAMLKLGYSPAKIRKEAMKILNADAEFRKAVAKNTLEHKKEVKKLLKEITGEAYKAGNTLLSGAGNMAWANDLSVWKEGTMELTESAYLAQLVKAYAAQTKGELKNLTQSTGFKTMSGFETVESLYRRELDKAMIKICSGTFSKEQVMRETIHELAKSGLRSIDYASGRSMQLDTAVSLALRTGCLQLSAKITDENIKNTGVNLVYVSKHWGARNTGIGHANHEQWQGKVYFIKDGTNYIEEARRIGQDRIMSLWYATGYSIDGSRKNDPEGLYGYNCRHCHYPWFLGVSSLPKEDPEPKPVTYKGTKYDYYAMTQKMRSMERNVRALKREREALKALGMDTKEIEVKISHKVAEYKDFCKTCKLKEKTARMRYESGTSDLKKTKAWKRYEEEVHNSKKSVADSESHDTIEKPSNEKGIEVRTVGKIDRNIYKCITEDIVTDEVIITDERIQHIKDRHPDDYERFCAYIPEIISNPDYIIRANKPNTATVLKEVVEGNEKFQLVLRIITSTDDPSFKNSVITFLNINERTWNKYLRNKDILYKKE